MFFEPLASFSICPFGDDKRHLQLLATAHVRYFGIRIKGNWEVLHGTSLIYLLHAPAWSLVQKKDLNIASMWKLTHALIKVPVMKDTCQSSLNTPENVICGSLDSLHPFCSLVWSAKIKLSCTIYTPCKRRLWQAEWDTNIWHYFAWRPPAQCCGFLSNPRLGGIPTNNIAAPTWSYGCSNRGQTSWSVFLLYSYTENFLSLWTCATRLQG